MVAQVLVVSRVLQVPLLLEPLQVRMFELPQQFVADGEYDAVFECLDSLGP